MQIADGEGRLEIESNVTEPFQLSVQDISRHGLRTASVLRTAFTAQAGCARSLATWAARPKRWASCTRCHCSCSTASATSPPSTREIPVACQGRRGWQGVRPRSFAW